MGLRVLHTPRSGARKRRVNGVFSGRGKMVNASETRKLPPGSDGLPLLGETLSFIRDVFGFIHQRSQRYGPVFRTHLLGKPTVFISGPQLAEKWLDPALIDRAGALPANLFEPFVGD